MAVDGGEDTAAVAGLDLPAPPPAGDGSALAGAGSTRAAARRGRIRSQGTDPPAPLLLGAYSGQCWRPRCRPVFGRRWSSPPAMK